MKMLLAIINSDDAPSVMGNLMKQGYQITKLATTGGFLRAGNVTILIGLEEEQLERALSIIRTYSSSRKQVIPTTAEMGMGFYPTLPVEVEVGGATVFVLGDEISLLRASMALEKQPRPTQRALLLLLRTAGRDALFASSGLSGRLLPALSGETAALARAVDAERLLRLSGFLVTLGDRLDVNAASAATSSALTAGAFTICYAP